MLNPNECNINLKLKLNFNYLDVSVCCMIHSDTHIAFCVAAMCLLSSFVLLSNQQD